MSVWPNRTFIINLNHSDSVKRLTVENADLKTRGNHSVQFSPLTDLVVGETWQAIQQRSSASLFCRRLLWAVPAQVGMSTPWCLSIQHFLFQAWRRPSSKMPWGMVWRGYHGAWHSRTMQISVSWQLPELNRIWTKTFQLNSLILLWSWNMLKVIESGLKR